jgi:peptidoglycan hydrolase-like protein with peptidoglycan-binding domain
LNLALFDLEFSLNKSKEINMAASNISASVGRGGVNRQPDVLLVQQVLLARGQTDLVVASGVCDAATVAAIVAFQAAFMRTPDGKIDPGGTTWRHLAASFTGSTTSPPAPSGVGTGSVTRPVPLPAPSSINAGLASARNDFMLQNFGQPLTAMNYSSLCQTPTNPKLRRNLVLDTIGPFRVTGLVPAVLSLKAIMLEIAAAHPNVYSALGTAGMLCCRLQRGSNTAISNHSFGTAIDITLNGELDAYGDGKVQYGLTLIAPIFNRHGWYWGAAFGKEDGMHFEGGKALIEQWAAGLR